jgi:glyoxylase I family protein
MPTFSRALHMALTVRDMRVSADWDERVLGFDFVKEFEADPGDAGSPGSCCSSVQRLPARPVQPAGRTGDAFDPLRTGLGHVAYEVAGRAELDSWIARLDHLAVSHSPVRELGHSSLCLCRTLTGFRSSCG